MFRYPYPQFKVGNRLNGKVRGSRRSIPVVSAGPQHQPSIKHALKLGENKVSRILKLSGTLRSHRALCDYFHFAESIAVYGVKLIVFSRHTPASPFSEQTLMVAVKLCPVGSPGKPNTEVVPDSPGSRFIMEEIKLQLLLL